MRGLIFAIAMMLVGCGSASVGADDGKRLWHGQVDESGQDSRYIGPTDGREVRFWCIEHEQSHPRPVRWIEKNVISIDCAPWNFWHVETFVLPYQLTQ